MAVSEAGSGKGLCLLSSAEPGVSQLPGTAALTGNEAEQSLGKRRDCGWGECGGSTAGNHSTANPQTSPKMPAEKRRAGVTQGCHRGVHGWDTAGTSPGSSQGWGAQSPQTQLGVGLGEGRSLPRVSAGKLKIK